eukprot:CAMPEP_0172811618 /NCGR_PEP_ID=MMETSP1075-20121228/9529_1 /TAXON_ID=2916 /ORGANISM="Ceratium fusus, Strain PA161109" /LENGTH=260 /DNA_ID=CAMNT_0013651067 /DNA_START=46 /DNA_END=829 /DNA_ORIENTATION=+
MAETPPTSTVASTPSNPRRRCSKDEELAAQQELAERLKLWIEAKQLKEARDGRGNWQKNWNRSPRSFSGATSPPQSPKAPLSGAATPTMPTMRSSLRQVSTCKEAQSTPRKPRPGDAKSCASLPGAPVVAGQRARRPPTAGGGRVPRPEVPGSARCAAAQIGAAASRRPNAQNGHWDDLEEMYSFDRKKIDQLTARSRTASSPALRPAPLVRTPSSAKVKATSKLNLAGLDDPSCRRIGRLTPATLFLVLMKTPSVTSWA